MREPTLNERIVQGTLAVLIVAPLVMAFMGENSASNHAVDSQPATPAEIAAVAATAEAHRAALLFAGARSLMLAFAAMFVAACIGIPAAWALAQRERPLALMVICA